MGYTVDDLSKANSYVLANGVALLVAYAVTILIDSSTTSATS